LEVPKERRMGESRREAAVLPLANDRKSLEKSDPPAVVLALQRAVWVATKVSLGVRTEGGTERR
jgi:hypothetical protein